MENRKNQDYFSDLPQEVLLHLFAFLSPSALQALALTCRLFNAVIKDDKLWEEQIRKQFGIDLRGKHIPEYSVKERFVMLRKYRSPEFIAQYWSNLHRSAGQRSNQSNNDTAPMPITKLSSGYYKCGPDKEWYRYDVDPGLLSTLPAALFAVALKMKSAKKKDSYPTSENSSHAAMTREERTHSVRLLARLFSDAYNLNTEPEQDGDKDSELGPKWMYGN